MTKLISFFLVSCLLTFNSVQAINAANYTTSNGEIYKNGNQIQLHGINWFGFETKIHVIHGLWARNYQDMIGQIKSEGFTAVRIPFCPVTLENVTLTEGADYSLNGNLQGKKSLEVMDIILNELDRQGLYILLDHHFLSDCATFEPLWYNNTYTEQEWINDLVFVSQRYSYLDKFLGIELKNEPHGTASWGTGNNNTDWNKAAERAGEQVHTANSNILVFVSGIEGNSVCSNNSFNHYWGENIQPIQCHPLNSSKIPATKLVLSPHVYGPSVYYQSYFDNQNFPENMPEIWNQHFGFAQGQYTLSITEWGGHYGHTGTIKDKVWQDRIVEYFIDKNMCNNFYWSWNPNSYDTGGYLQDDWNSVWADKRQLLARYKQGCDSPSSPSPTPNNNFLSADLNQDGIVNIFDFTILANDFLKTNPSNARSDINQDGIVNIFDFTILSNQFLQRSN